MSGASDSLEQTIKALVAARAKDLRKILNQATSLHAWGSLLKFGAGGNGLPHLGSGWSAPEPGFTWSVGPVATLVFPTPAPCLDVQLRVHLTPFYAKAGNHQTIRIMIAGRQVAAWHADGTGWFAARIPAGLLVPGRTDLRFLIESPISPAEAGTGDDDRELGFALSELVMDEITDGISQEPPRSTERIPGQ